MADIEFHHEEATVLQTLRFLNENPVFGPTKVQRYFKVTWMTAMRWLEGWERNGFVIRIPSTKCQYQLVIKAEKK